MKMILQYYVFFFYIYCIRELQTVSASASKVWYS